MGPEITTTRRSGHDPSASALSDRVAAALEAAAMGTLLLVVAMRPLLAETFESARDPVSAALDLPGALTPGATAAFDLIVWLAALAAAAAMALRRLAWRFTGLEAGWWLMLAGAVVSTLSASNRRLAINCSADWLTAVVLAAVLANLCRTRRRVALVLAVLAASGLVSAARCVMQVRVERAETYQQYQETKEQIWRSQNKALDDPYVELYERRLRANEASGFLAMSNAQGALLGLSGFALLAVASGGSGLGRRMLLAALAAILMAAILMTGSLGALLATAAGLAVVVALWRFQERLRPHWRWLLAAAWAALAIGTVAVAAYGRAHGGLPGSSLNFRWQYWQVTRSIVADHFWSGVGAGNFDRAYLARKPITYPEEIKDPHHFALSILAQWGALGGAGLLLAIAGASAVAARRWGHADDPEAGPDTGRIRPGWLVGLPAAFLLLRLCVQSDLLAGDEAARALLVFDLGFYGLLWAAAFAATAALTGRVLPDDAGLYRLPVLAGVAAFLLANTIDFSILQPGTLTPFAAMAGVLLAGGPRPGAPRGSLSRHTGPVAWAGLGLAAFFALVFWPVTRASHWLSIARATQGPPAIAACEAAAAADPRDPTPLVEMAERSGRSDRIEDVNRAANAIHEAILRDPDRLQLYRYRASILEARYRLAGSAADLLGAIGAARHCIELYPESPEAHWELADLLDRANADLNSPPLRAEAISHARQALALNDARPGTDEARRWSPARTAEIRRRLEAMESADQPRTTIESP